ncbi:HAMP domain-containing sensor histidine kinase [Pseudomonas sp.]|uniref:HAMP domain-containing sensor histidine kinase n=1 Tax=Pseudomonas sp. TaxID=306 RepID=UPI003A9779E5
MRSLFWRIFASFWLAIALVAGLSMLLGRALNQDSWILNNTPALQGIAETWTERYESGGKGPAQAFLRHHKDKYQVDVQVLGENGQQLVPGTFPARAAAFESRQKDKRLPWRRLTTEYISPTTNKTYLFIYRIPYPVLKSWHRDSLLWPISALVIALVVLTALSLLLTLSITRPLDRLRSAVHDLGQTSYQQNSLAHLSKRRDELGVLANDFNRMGARLQGLIGSQRQLLRDVSHELRSPLARLRIAIALAERASAEERKKLWPRLTKECDRLEALISEILELARLDANPGAVQKIKLQAVLQKLVEYVQISAPEQRVNINIAPGLELTGWPNMLERALDNLLRNALRFNPPGQPIEVNAQPQDGAVVIQVRDHGPGVDEQYLKQLGEPFFRAPGQTAPGHGLGLAIARRAVERHSGKLVLENHAQGGFCASLFIATQANAKS